MLNFICKEIYSLFSGIPIAFAKYCGGFFMKRTTMLLLLLLMGLAFLTMSCGDQTSPPDGSTVAIDPPKIEMSTPDNAVQNYRVTVRYADGTPIPYAQVKISSAFAAPYATPQYQFYWYIDATHNPNGNVAVDSSFVKQTDEFGFLDFSIEILGTSSFDDTIYVAAGTASATSTIKFNK